MFDFVLLAASAAVVFAGVQPQLASAGNRIYLAFGQGDAISVARSVDGGQTFRPATPLPIAGKLSLGMRRGPRIAATSSAVLVTAVVGAKGGGADGDILLFRSIDEGGTWAAPVAINDVPGSAREGMHAMAANRAGLVVVAWLDLRQKGTRIYAAISRDHGATWAPDALVYEPPSGAVCECCHPSAAVDDEGRVAIMFRNNVDGRRDLYVTQSSDAVAFTPATKQGTGSWTLNACPMDGGGVVLTADGAVSAWRRENDVFLTSARAPEQRLGEGRDPVVVGRGSHVDVAWSVGSGIVLMRDAAAPMALGEGRFPSLLAFDRQTIVAWEHQGAIKVQAIAR